MASQPPQPDGKTFAAAVLTVAAVYVYFLIFAQFGFLQALRTVLVGRGEMVRPVMAAMGAAGIAGSIIAACGFGPGGPRRWLMGGFTCCALGVAFSLGARGAAGFFTAAALTGLGAGLTTVTLAGMLRPAVGGEKLGLIIGLGTGVAYGFCNLPGIFDADADTQAGLALGAVALGAVGGVRLPARFPPGRLRVADYSRAGIARWVTIFLALVGLDSALFYFIQHHAPLRQQLWGSSGILVNAGMHLVAATFAGWALDRSRLGSVVLVGGSAVVSAAFWIATGRTENGVVGLVYIAGVSAYSTALVFYPAQGGRPALAAWVYAIAGWVGTAVGIGLAEARDQWSILPAAVAMVMLAIGFGGRHLASRRGRTMKENSGP